MSSFCLLDAAGGGKVTVGWRAPTNGFLLLLLLVLLLELEEQPSTSRSRSTSRRAVYGYATGLRRRTIGGSTGP
jgi:hypothetical protein